MKNDNKSKQLFENKIFRICLSVIASLLIWIYITGNQEQTITREFSGIEVVFSGIEELQQSKGYVVTDVDTEVVTIRITGTRTNIGKLDESDLQAVIDLSKVTKTGNNRVSYTITYPDSVNTADVAVVSRSPENIQFYVAKLSSKTVPVKGVFLGSTAENYVAEDLVFNPETITLTGPDSEIANIEYVWATIGGEDITKTLSADVSFTYMDKDGNKLDYEDIVPNYDTVTITQPISLMKEVPLSVTLVDGAGATADNSLVAIEPSTITISGDSSIVEGINKIVLATIDLTDFSSTFEDTFPIVLDNNVQNVTGTTEARVSIEIIGLATKNLTLTNISVINAPEGFTTDILTESIVVTVRAAEDVLLLIGANNLRAVADLSGYASTGDASVPVKIYVDGYSAAGAIGDYKVTVNIK